MNSQVNRLLAIQLSNSVFLGKFQKLKYVNRDPLGSLFPSEPSYRPYLLRKNLKIIETVMI